MNRKIVDKLQRMLANESAKVTAKDAGNLLKVLKGADELKWLLTRISACDLNDDIAQQAEDTRSKLRFSEMLAEAKSGQ